MTTTTTMMEAVNPESIVVSCSSLDTVCDNSLGEILVFLDFRSAVIVARLVSKSLRHRISAHSSVADADRASSVSEGRSSSLKPAFAHLWEEIYRRHGFFPIEKTIQNSRELGNDRGHWHPEQIDALEECRIRRQLHENLSYRRKKRTSGKPTDSISSSKHNEFRNCFSLPHRRFFFVPILPSYVDDIDDDNDSDNGDGQLDHRNGHHRTADTLENTANEQRQPLVTWEDDSTPVDFDCHSFVLTSPGTSAELMFLHPLDGSLCIYESCLENAIASDDAMIEQAMKDAATLIRRRSSLGLDADLADEQIAGAIIDESVYRNHNVEHYQTDPKETLLDMYDYFNIDLSDYFRRGHSTADTNGRDTVGLDGQRQMMRNDSDMPVLQQNDEVEIAWLGIDAVTSVDTAGNLVKRMYGIGRQLSVESSGRNDGRVCTELTAWEKPLVDDYKATNAAVSTSLLASPPPPLPPPSSSTMQRLVCRLPYTVHGLFMSPIHRLVYVVYPFGEGPYRRTDADSGFENESNDLDFMAGGCTLVAYPLQEWRDNSWNGTDDSSDDELNGTDGDSNNGNGSSHNGYDTSAADEPCYFPQPAFVVRCKAPICTVYIDPTEQMLLLLTSAGEIEIHRLDGEGTSAVRMKTISIAKALRRTGDATANGNGRRRDMVGVLRDPLYKTAIQGIHHPQHLPFFQSGFITAHYTRQTGSRVIVWCKGKAQNEQTDEYGFAPVSVIDLSLSKKRKPKTYYDGRRLIVYGEDTVGMVILVYHVMQTWEDLGAFVGTNRDGSLDGGIQNLTVPGRVRLANRIRHAALGGLDYESIFITCNERFIIVNTKTGNLLGGGSTPSTDGLLVIDLEDTITQC